MTTLFEHNSPRPSKANQIAIWSLQVLRAGFARLWGLLKRAISEIASTFSPDD